GELASEIGLTGWGPGEATRACEQCLNAWLNGRGGSRAFDEVNGIAAVKLFLEAHESRFQDFKSNTPVPNRVGFRQRKQNGETDYMILLEVFRTEACRGLDHRQAVAALRKQGYLETDKGRLDKQVRIPGLGRTRVYVVKGSIFS